MKNSDKVRCCLRKDSFLNALDVTSAMVFSSPLMCSGTSVEHFACIVLIPRTLSSRAAVVEVDVRSLCVQLTADALSQNAPMWQCSRVGVICSSMTKFMTIPNSSRSFIVIFPSGFASVHNSFCMLSGNGTCHTIGFIPSVPDVQIPPTPPLQASL